MEDYIRIATLENEVEGNMLRDMLDEREIPHAVITFHDSALPGIDRGHEGWGAVDGPASRKDEVLALLAELRNAPPVDPADTGQA